MVLPHGSELLFSLTRISGAVAYVGQELIRIGAPRELPTSPVISLRHESAVGQGLTARAPIHPGSETGTKLLVHD
jgi:hypothetical protein